MILLKPEGSKKHLHRKLHKFVEYLNLNFAVC